MPVAHESTNDPCVDVPTVCRGKIPGDQDSLSVQWYGLVHEREVPSRQFQFPLNVTLKAGFMYLNPTHFEIIFFGRPQDWPRWPPDVDLDAIQDQLLRLTGHDRACPLLVSYSPYLGMFATPLTVKPVHDGGIVRPKPYDRVTNCHVRQMFANGSGYAWVKVDPHLQPGMLETAPIWGVKSS